MPDTRIAATDYDAATEPLTDVELIALARMTERYVHGMISMADSVEVRTAMLFLRRVQEEVADAKLGASCRYTHSHTRAFCGNPTCRES